MLFNSYEFIVVFVPIVLMGYQLAGRFHRKAVVIWLGLASLAFYTFWRPALICILVGSVSLNYVAGGLISRQIPNKISSRAWLTLAIVLDLAVLCYFKYFFPSLNFLSSLAGSSRHWQDVVLPLGISFFTFTQIAFLIDLHQGIAKHQDLSSYVLFVTFFPHLIAGPILHHKDMMPQFQQDRLYELNFSDLAVGFSWFILGLGKKVLIADRFALLANPVFNTTQTLTSSTAWVGALAYSLQLYFDFSGYSDMALGLARMFSINFPLNFNSPFKAASIIDFWQRWHMTLSHYIMAYLYAPIQRWVRAARQGTGKGVSRKDMRQPRAFTSIIALPMISTMLIAGIWHGAGFQFIVFGLLHGLYLTANHAWRLLPGKQSPDLQPSVFARGFRHSSSVLLTFLCVLVTFVFFRARSTAHAVSILSAMIGVHGSPAFDWYGGIVYKLKVAAGLMIVWFLPNTQQILSRFKPSLQQTAWTSVGVPRIFQWSPDITWALALGTLFLAVLVEMQNPSTFLYFQF